MSNTLKVTDKLAAVALSIFKQKSFVAQNSVRSYEDEFAGAAAKIGDSVRVKVPSKYSLQSGNNRTTPQAIEQQTKTLQLTENKFISLNLTSQELAVFTGTDAKAQAELLEQPIANLARYVDTFCFGLMAQYAASVNVKKSLTELGYKDISSLNAAMATQLAPTDRVLAGSAFDLASVQQSQAGLYNPNAAIAESYMEGIANTGLGFGKWYESQSTGSIAIGTATGFTMNGAPNENATSITIQAITGTIKAGQAIEITGVYALDPQTLVAVPRKASLIVAADVANGDTTITLTSKLITTATSLTLANVSALPGAAVTGTVVESGDAGKICTNVLAWTKKAFALAFMDLPTDLPGAEASKVSEDGVSIRIARQAALRSNSVDTIADVQFGGLVLRPEWIAAIRGVGA